MRSEIHFVSPLNELRTGKIIIRVAIGVLWQGWIYADVASDIPCTKQVCCWLCNLKIAD
jgi:hypothetical protein